MVKLVFQVHSKKNNSIFESEVIVYENIAIIGRDQCDLTLDDPFISRQHAAIVVLPGRKLQVRDLQSRNGLYLNEKRVEAARLTIDDCLQLGDYTLTLKAIKRTHSQDPGRTVITNVESIQETNPVINQALAETRELVRQGWPGGWDCMDPKEQRRFDKYKPKANK